MCGNMVDGLLGSSLSIGFPEVNLSQSALTEEDVEQAIGVGWPEGDRVPAESLRDTEDPALKKELSLSLYLANEVVRSVDDGRQWVGKGPGAVTVAASWHLKADTLVGPVEVVSVSPAVQVSLALG